MRYVKLFGVPAAVWRAHGGAKRVNIAVPGGALHVDPAREDVRARAAEARERWAAGVVPERLPRVNPAPIPGYA